MNRESAAIWYGHVGDSWAVRRFKHAAMVVGGQVDPTDERYRELPLYAPNHMESGTGRLLSVGTADEQAAESGKYLVRGGDVLYSKIRPALRKVIVAPQDGLCSADVYAVRPASADLESRFIFYLLLSEGFYQYSLLESDRVAMPKINREALGECPLVFPAADRQKRITDFLDRKMEVIDELISKKERLVALLEEKRRALITQVVTKGLDPTARMKDSGVGAFGAIPSHWQILPLRRLVRRFVDYRGRTPTKVDDGIPLITAGAIRDPKEIGEQISALSNSAALAGKAFAYLAWGVEDSSHEIVGTTFVPAATKVGNEELESWLLKLLSPKIEFRFFEVEADGKHTVILEIERARGQPVQFHGEKFIRVGTYRKKLKDFPEKERALWRIFDQVPFEGGTAAERVGDDEVLKLLDHPSYFDLTGRPPPTAKQAILDALAEDALSDARLVLELARKIQDKVRGGGAIDTKPVTIDVQQAIGRLGTARTTFQDRTAGLRGRAEEREKALSEATAKRDLLEARIVLRRILPAVETFVERSRWVNVADGVLRKLKTTAKTLTEASKEASERLINHDFEKHFREECRRLNAPHVNLDFKGQKGEAARKKQLRPEYRLTDSLSEGEQKVIALADFLAEARLRTTNAPIVFDDPVTSLDYERIREVASRLAALAQDRQVIVFTHNIWFAVELLERFRDRRDDCSYYDVRVLEGGRGIVSGGTHPRSDSLSDLRKRLNTTLAEARKAAGEIQDALVFRGYSILRALCEVAVESELFHGVVRRYEPNIRLTVLPEVKPVALKAAGEVIHPVYEETCRYIEAHSQPLEHLNIVRTADELERDFKAVQNAIDSYRKAAA